MYFQQRSDITSGVGPAGPEERIPQSSQEMMIINDNQFYQQQLLNNYDIASHDFQVRKTEMAYPQRDPLNQQNSATYITGGFIDVQEKQIDQKRNVGQNNINSISPEAHNPQTYRHLPANPCSQPLPDNPSFNPAQAGLTPEYAADQLTQLTRMIMCNLETQKGMEEDQNQSVINQQQQQTIFDPQHDHTTQSTLVDKFHHQQYQLYQQQQQQQQPVQYSSSTIPNKNNNQENAQQQQYNGTLPQFINSLQATQQCLMKGGEGIQELNEEVCGGDQQMQSLGYSQGHVVHQQQYEDHNGNLQHLDGQPHHPQFLGNQDCQSSTFQCDDLNMQSVTQFDQSKWQQLDGSGGIQNGHQMIDMTNTMNDTGTHIFQQDIIDSQLQQPQNQMEGQDGQNQIQELLPIQQCVYGLLSGIQDPDSENSTLADNGIIHPEFITSNENDLQRIAFECPITISVYFKPLTIFAMNAHLVGLAIRAKLDIFLPRNQFKVNVYVIDDSHINKFAIDKQINDKERVSSAFEQDHIWKAILKLIMQPSVAPVRSGSTSTNSTMNEHHLREGNEGQ